MDCFQGQDVAQEVATDVITETIIHTTALTSSYASTQATANTHPAATSPHSSVAVTVQRVEPSGASQSSGAGSSTTLPAPDGFPGTNMPHISATALKASSPPVCGSFGPLLLPLMVLTYCIQDWMSNVNSTKSDL